MPSNTPDLISSPNGQKSLIVLLVEDNENDAVLLERHFFRAGYDVALTRVETAPSMRSALNGDGARWDVVLADYNLPAFSAPAALRLLKEAGHDIPFIMMSGAVSEETAVEAMRAGAQDYVSKQNLTRLIPAIEREIGEARARRHKHETEAALRASEERFHRLVQAMPLGLIITEGSERLIYANQSIERLLGYTPEELRSGAISLNEILHPEGQETLARLRGSLALNTPSRTFEAVCRSRSGQTVPVLIGLTLLAPEVAGQQQVAAFFVDLSDQKRSEEVLRRTEKLAAAGRLAASIAHEINNPLESVTNCLYLLDTTELEPRAREYLKMAHEELNRVAQITTQTLRFYRQSTKPAQSNLNELLETVVALYEARMRAMSIAIERRYRSIPSTTVFEGEIRQVLVNLVGNAIDAMQNSGGRLILKTALGRDWKTGAAGVCVTVADTGCGMEPATLARIFEPFFSTKDITGTGLGLWVSQSILEKHHGAARVRSTAARGVLGAIVSGTVFRIFLPVGVEPSQGIQNSALASLA